MKEKQLVAACVIAALVGLAALVAFARSIEPVERSVGELSSEDVGRLVAVKATVVKTTFGHAASIKLCEGNACLNVFLPSSLVRELNSSGFDFNRVRKGALLRVEGVLREGKYGLELTPFSQNAFEIID